MIRDTLLNARVIAVAGLVALGFGQAVATQQLFQFTYSDGLGNAADGQIDATLNLDGSYTATTGWMVVTATQADHTDDFVAGGGYTLFPGSGTSPSGKFSFDNLLFPGTPTALLDNGGLLFTRTEGSATREFNIWGLGKSQYDYFSYSPDQGIYNPTATGTFTLTAVPEPFTLALCGAGLGLAIARRRKAKKA